MAYAARVAARKEAEGDCIVRLVGVVLVVDLAPDDAVVGSDEVDVDDNELAWPMARSRRVVLASNGSVERWCVLAGAQAKWTGLASVGLGMWAFLGRGTTMVPRHWAGSMREVVT